MSSFHCRPSPSWALPLRRSMVMWKPEILMGVWDCFKQKPEPKRKFSNTRTHSSLKYVLEHCWTWVCPVGALRPWSSFLCLSLAQMWNSVDLSTILIGTVDIALGNYVSNDQGPHFPLSQASTPNGLAVPVSWNLWHSSREWGWGNPRKTEVVCLSP